MRTTLNVVQKNLADLIEQSGLTVNGWAVKHQFPQSTIKRICDGDIDPTSMYVKRLADAAGVPHWQFYVPGGATQPALQLVAPKQAAKRRPSAR